jgi:hypothetical protein
MEKDKSFVSHVTEKADNSQPEDILPSGLLANPGDVLILP